MDRISVMLSPQSPYSYQSCQSGRWQAESARLSDEEARIRSQLIKAEDQIGKWIKRLDEIAARQIDLQALLEG